ncbi:hypothetical protein KCU81_g1862, partial [Aureobasidium melanogenum]|uniref:Uncharacterized protein n=1 Tax=Aureobasidium melanogenum (strain CBS 110374) TaxID=1043003 RepID=A0A074VXW6_AURM1
MDAGLGWDGDAESAWEYGEEMPPKHWAELVGGDDPEDEDDNGPSVEPDPHAYTSVTQDLLDMDPNIGIDTAASSDDYDDDDDEEEEIVFDEDQEISRETEFAVLALGREDPAHIAIESIREPAGDEYEEDEDANGVVVIKKRSELKGNPEFEGKLPVLDPRVADNLTGSFATIMLRYYLDADMKHTTRDKDIFKKGIINCSTHKDIDKSASCAFVLGDQNDSLEGVAERLSQEKTISDGRENWIPFGDVYRQPGTNDIEVRAMSEDQLEKLAQAMDLSIEGVLEKLAEQVGRYKR